MSNNNVLIAFVAAAAIALVYYNTTARTPNSQGVVEQPRIENVLYVFTVAFALTYILLFAFSTDRPSSRHVMNEIEVGEPDF